MEWLSDNALWAVPAIVFGSYYAALAILRIVAPRTENTWDDKVLKYMEDIDTEQLRAWVTKLNQELAKRTKSKK